MNYFESRLLKTMLGQKCWNSVSVHGVFIPSTNIQNYLHTFGLNLVRYTHDQDYKIHLIGSATCLDYRKAKFVVCTTHQLKGVDTKEDIGIILPFTKNFISSAGYICSHNYSRPQEHEAQDLCAFDYTAQVKEKQELGHHFFKLKYDVVLTDNDKILAYLAYGRPFSDQKYNIIDDNHLGLVTRSITCEHGDVTRDPAMGQCKPKLHMEFDPNGLSGGPVFATVETSTGLVLKFAGTINRANKKIIHFIKAKVIQSLLDKYFLHETF